MPCFNLPTQKLPLPAPSQHQTKAASKVTSTRSRFTFILASFVDSTVSDLWPNCFGKCFFTLSAAIFSGNGINNNNIEVMIMKKQPISNVIDPRTTKATVRVIENFNKQFVSHHYISKIWLSDPNYHYFVDDLQNYSSFN
ncbi:hypothetical protein ES332_D10G285200v1 [Gossypium tomentosum]|uniref:Uncharacterized protein n=1 Tax=Gossypium tomentosum TaxID=34277 RepID=A0A5D2JBY9_GOSTO|nr:hypothetical protein ES332_D10G285200v1 [Gossypium tomentosum]